MWRRDKTIARRNTIQKQEIQIKWFLGFIVKSYDLYLQMEPLLIQLVLYIFLGYSVKIIFSSDIGKPNGYISLEEDFMNCNKTIEKWEEEELLLQNINYNFLVIIA